MSSNTNECLWPNPEPSVSPQEVINLFKAALEKPDWIDNDRVPDQFPRTGEKSGSGVPALALDNGVNINQGKKRGISKSLGVELEQLTAKRRKAD
jgi:hypothetical protein